MKTQFLFCSFNLNHTSQPIFTTQQIVQQNSLVIHAHRHRIPDPLLLRTHTFKANRGGDGCKFYTVKCEACLCIAVVMSDSSCRGALKETLTFQHQSLQDTHPVHTQGRNILLLRLQISMLTHLILKSALK